MTKNKTNLLTLAKRSEIEAAKYDGYLDGIQVRLDEDDKTIRQLAAALDKAMDWWDGTERHPDTMQTIRNDMRKALSDNASRILEAQEDKADGRN